MNLRKFQLKSEHFVFQKHLCPLWVKDILRLDPPLPTSYPVPRKT